MQQFLLIFFINTTTAILHAHYRHIIFFFQRYQNFRSFIAELDGITYQIANHRFNHINICTYFHTFIRNIHCYTDILQTSYHRKDLADSFHNFYHIDILVNNLQLTDLALRPLQ